MSVVNEVLQAQLLTGTPSYGTRVYPVQAAQGAAYPFLTYKLVSETVTHAMGEDPNVQISRWQVSAWADRYATAKTAARDAATALSRFRTISGGVVIWDVLKELEIDMPFDADALLYHVAQDFLVFHAN
jgi:hypothetical protein